MITTIIITALVVLLFVIASIISFILGVMVSGLFIIDKLEKNGIDYERVLK